VAGLTRCLGRLIADPALRVRLGAAARESALRRFDAGAFTRAFVDVYHQARTRAMSHVSH
jgi:hypothetical protein